MSSFQSNDRFNEGRVTEEMRKHLPQEVIEMVEAGIMDTELLFTSMARELIFEKLAVDMRGYLIEEAKRINKLKNNSIS